MRKKIFRYTIIITAFLWIAGYALFVANIVIKFTPQSYNTLEKTDAIIVLTGGNDRITTGLNLFVAGFSKKLFISGVNKSVHKDDIIKMWKADAPLPDCCIILGYEAKTTLENAIEAKKWIDSEKITTVRLITSAYHMDRALLEFNHKIKNIKIIPYPVAEQRSLNDIKFWKITFSEYNKLLFRYAVITIKGQ